MQTQTQSIPHGTNSGYKHHRCRCIPCADAAAAYQRRRYRRMGAGVWQPFVDTAPALAHIETLRTQRMAVGQIAIASRVPRTTLDRIRGVSAQPTIYQIRPTTEARILAVRYDVAALTPLAHVPTTGAIRRLQALRAIGWPVHAIATRCGIDRRTLVALPRKRIVYAETHLMIALVYDDLHDQNPTDYGIREWVADRSRREARAAGWAVPAAWTDIDTDTKSNPTIHRMGYRPTPPARPRDELVAETFNLAAGGATRTEIAQRLGLNWDSIEQAHRRGEQPLPLALRS